jgi:hypothetical protein
MFHHQFAPNLEEHMIGKWVVINKKTKMSFPGFYDSEGDARNAIVNGIIDAPDPAYSVARPVRLDEVSIVQIQNPFPNSAPPIKTEDEAIVDPPKVTLYLFDRDCIPSSRADGGGHILMLSEKDGYTIKAGILTPTAEDGEIAIKSLQPHEMIPLMAKMIMKLYNNP